MNSLERIKAAISFAECDRVPVIVQAFGWTARIDNVNLNEYLKQGEILARCQISAQKKFGYDAVFGLMDVAVETEAIGSSLSFNNNNYPNVSKYAFDEGTDFNTVTIPNPYKDGRMPELLKAIRILHQEYKDKVLVVGCVVGPMTLATQLMGAEKLLYFAVDHPDRFFELLKFCTEVIKVYGISQIHSGADLPMVFEPSSSPEVIPASFFREFILPCLKDIFSALKKEGALANWLHIAGNTKSILPFYAQAGIDIANFDYCVTSSEAIKNLPQTCLDGNIRPLALVEDDAELITKQSQELLVAFSKRKGFILSSGCEIPLDSKPENIIAMVKAVR